MLACLAAPAWPAPPAPDRELPKGAQGSIVQFEERKTPGIVYFEEKGGIVLPIAPPIRDRDEPLPETAKVEPVKPAPATKVEAPKAVAAKAAPSKARLAEKR